MGVRFYPNLEPLGFQINLKGGSWFVTGCSGGGFCFGSFFRILEKSENLRFQVGKLNGKF